MKALVFELSVPKYLMSRALGKLYPQRYFSKLSCLSLKDIPVPALPSDDWVLVKTEACGICGSDLAALRGKDSFSMEPYSSFPATMGHEAIGRIVKNGKGVTGFKEGDRVAIDSILPCVTREIEPVCSYCQSGDYSLCDNFRGGSLSAGPVNGFNRSVGGGFAEHMIAHKNRLFKLPDTLPSNQAVLIDPLASSLQPAATHLPHNDATVLVYGSGIIGILLIKSLRALGSLARIISIARYDFQAKAVHDAGADEVIRQNLFDNFAKVTDSKKLKPTIGKPVFEGGVDIVFDCVGSADTIDNSLRFTKKRGKVVVVGTSGTLKNLDTSPIWFKEIQLTGSSMYSQINTSGYRVRTYKAALSLILSGQVKTDGLVTHSYDITDYKEAINTSLNKKRTRSIKVIFNKFYS